MAVIRCSNNHFFDDSKFNECPHCKRLASGAVEDHKPTVAKFKVDFTDDTGVTQSLRSQVDDVQKTVSVYASKNNNTNPVVGWLVCTEGQAKGRSHEIHVGKNFAGRSMKMDIHLNDEKISRENHFTIIFDPKSIKFFLAAGNGITYYNDKMLNSTADLSEGDFIGAGESKYAFIPFCKEGRVWE